MRKVILVLASTFVLGAANAQSGKNQIGIGAEVGIGTASGSSTMFGGSVKYLHGIGDMGQITLSAGYLMSSESEDGMEAKSSLIPIFVGYRHYFSGVFVEPQIGYTMAKSTFKMDGFPDQEFTNNGLGYAIGAGYAMENGLDLGVRFQNQAKSGSVGAIIFRVGYNFNLGGN